jgi:hypothetical protein
MAGHGCVDRLIDGIRQFLFAEAGRKTGLVGGGSAGFFMGPDAKECESQETAKITVDGPKPVVHVQPFFPFLA